mmetsp:Transcript_29921/g.44501  ORF Transcript_29921/g.44501 Transcript_29921/m.44501 type:complete len:91 (+) Transcript_29921:65-337(+)
MGNRPLRPEPDEAKELKADFHKNCALSAFALFEADVLILVTGAGFSADSGLAVYADVANVKAYEERNLTVSFPLRQQSHSLLYSAVACHD